MVALWASAVAWTMERPQAATVRAMSRRRVQAPRMSESLSSVILRRCDARLEHGARHVVTRVRS